MKPQEIGFYSSRDVQKLTTLSNATIWRMVKRGEFPKPVQISPGRVGYRREEVLEALARMGR